MKRFLEFIRNIPLRKKIKYSVMILCALLIVILVCIGNHYKNLTEDSKAASRWDKEGGYTQMSAYLPLGLMQDETLYDGMKYQMLDKLKAEGIQAESQDEKTILGAYSGYGTVTMKKDNNTASVDVIGVGGDFFYFHPLDMIDGSYLTEDYLMKDYVLLDKETAWDLFGAIEVTGMTVTINNIPFIVAGVYEPTDVYLAEEAGVTDNVVFMFYSSLSAHGTSSGIQWLDFLIPNPVKDFGMKIFKENGVVSLDDAVVVEQSTRYNLISLYKLVPDYAKRSMSQTGIVYPYWENMARGYENILVAFLLIETVCLVCEVVLLLITLRPVKNMKKGINWLVAKIRGRK